MLGRVRKRRLHAGTQLYLLNKGAGQFVNDCLACSGESATTVTPANLDGDGILDLVVIDQSTGSFVL